MPAVNHRKIIPAGQVKHYYNFSPSMLSNAPVSWVSIQVLFVVLRHSSYLAASMIFFFVGCAWNPPQVQAFAYQRACTCSALPEVQASVPPGNWASSTRLSSRTLGGGPPPPDGAAVVGLTDGGVREDWRRMRLRRRPLDARGPAIVCLSGFFLT